MSGPRYFVEDEPALAARVDAFLKKLGDDLGAQAWSASGAQALLLAGGYGRGEGGVFRESEGATAQLYNDLEFFLFLKPGCDDAAAAGWCAGWEKSGTAELGIDVEFKRLPASAVLAAAPTMFLHDLVLGNRPVWGDAGFLNDAPASLRDPAALPPEEVTRLLFNRGSGLWFARTRLAGATGEADGGFVERNHMKARLALGDAVLASSGGHHPLCLERARRIAAGGFPVPRGWERIAAWHAQGVAFKMRPRHAHPGTDALKQAQEELTRAWLDVFLWTEGLRLGREFPSPADYTQASRRLFPREPLPRNVALHLRDRLRRGEALPVARWTDYPRAALQRALVASLSGNAAGAARSIGAAPDAYAPAYARWWARYN